MDLIELLKKQERLREDYWENVDYFLPIRLKWRATEKARTVEGELLEEC